MKLSKYNFFFPIDEKDNYLAFNSLKNGLAVFPGKLVKLLQSFQPGSNLEVPENTLTELKKGGFICDDDYDEYGMLLVRRHLQQYSGDITLGLTIAPTLSCNLSCNYCFESPQNIKMDQTIISQVLEFTKKRIDAGLKNLYVTWYGGEPILCLDIIEELSRLLIGLCDQNKVKFNAHIITNGTLFTRATAEKLKSLKVNSVQITIDGDREMHDTRRPYHSGKGSYDDIYSNVIESAGIIPISLRVNVDRENLDAVLDSFKKMHSDLRLKDHFKKGDIKVNYGFVRKFSSSCRCSEEECLKPGEFWQEELKLHQHLYEKDITYSHYPSISSGCVATTINGYVVGPQGELYKCWNHIGENELIVGYIDKEIRLDSLYISYLNESFENDVNCRECKVLPICMGGCVDIRINYKKGTFSAIDCSRWKYYLEESLKAYYFASLKKPGAA